MEKYLRLLNPKSINYEADRIDGGTPSLTAQDVMLAMKYADLSALQDILIMAYISDIRSLELIDQLSVKIQCLLESGGDDSADDLILATKVALTEILAVSGKYKPSERNRAVIAGVSRMKIQRQLGSLINDVKSKLEVNLFHAQLKINKQVNKILKS